MTTIARLCRYLARVDHYFRNVTWNQFWEDVNVFLALWVSPDKPYKQGWRPKGK